MKEPTINKPKINRNKIKILNGFKISDSIINDKKRNESRLDFRFKNIMQPVVDLLEKKKYKYNIPLVSFQKNKIEFKDIHYDTYRQIIYVNKTFFDNSSDDQLKLFLLKEIANHYYNIKIFKNTHEMEVIRKYIIDNKKLLGRYTSYGFIYIPTKQEGICLPKVSITNINEFIPQLFVHYIQNLLPKNTNNKVLDDILEAISYYFIKP